jgi:hypothetical protein
VTSWALRALRASSWRWFALLALVALGVGLALVANGSQRKAAQARAPAGPASPPVEAPAATRRVEESVLVAAERAPAPPHDHGTRPEGPPHVHPLTPKHARIYRENRLISAMNGALDVRDAAGLRKHLAIYRAEFPEDTHALTEGYAIIADCLDAAGEAATDAARHYYAAQSASTLRRYVRRICWERTP